MWIWEAARSHVGRKRSRRFAGSRTSVHARKGKGHGPILGMVSAENGKAFVLHLGEVLNGECTLYKAEQIMKVSRHTEIGICFHHLSC